MKNDNKKSDESELKSLRREHSQLEVPVIFLISTRFHLSCGVTMELMLPLELEMEVGFLEGQLKFKRPNLVSAW